MKKVLLAVFLASFSWLTKAQDNVIDEIVWVVGDDAILRSDIEAQRLYLLNVWRVILIALSQSKWPFRSFI